MAPIRSSLAEEDRGEAAAEVASIPDWEALADLSAQGKEDGTKRSRKLLKSLDSRAEMARIVAAERRGAVVGRGR